LAATCRTEAERLKRAIEENAWDGQCIGGLLRRGHSLGSASNDECQIDSIAQSWAVLSGAGDPARARQALDASTSGWCAARTD